MSDHTRGGMKTGFAALVGLAFLAVGCVSTAFAQRTATTTLVAYSATPYFTDENFVTVIVTGTDRTPGGTVSYSVDGGPSQTVGLVPTSTSYITTATLALGLLPIGSHNVAATYNGNDLYHSSSGQLNLAVSDRPLAFLDAEGVFASGSQATVQAVASDGNGNLYVADAQGNVFLYDSTGHGTALPLTGLSNPDGLAFNNGNLYISDEGTNQVYEYTAAGEQTTVPFRGLLHPDKIAIGPNGEPYVVDTNHNRVVTLNADDTQIVVPATGLNIPTGVAVDAKRNVYIADYGNGRVVRVDASGNQLTVYNSPAPLTVTLDSNGNLYVTDYQTKQVVRIDPQGHHDTQMNSATDIAVDVAVDQAGNLFLPDASQTIKELSPIPAAAPTQVGSAASHVLLNYALPSGVALTASATDLPGNNEFTATSAATICTSASSECAYTLAFAPALPGTRSGTVTLTDGDLNLNTTVYGNGLAPLAVIDNNGYVQALNSGGLGSPAAVAVDEAGNVYVANGIGGTVYEIPVDGAPRVILNGLEFVPGVAVDGAGNVYATDATSSIYKIDRLGNLSTLVNDLPSPGALAVDGAGNVYAAAACSRCDNPGLVYKVDPLGNESVFAGALQTVPQALAVDTGGNVYASQSGGYLEIAPSLGITGIDLGFTPTGLAVDPAGELYAGDSADAQVYLFDVSGNKLTLPTANADGDGIAVGPTGTVYYASSSKSAIYAIDRSTGFLAFGSVPVGSTSPAQTQIVSNIGNQPMTIASETVPFGYSIDNSSESACVNQTPFAIGTDCSLLLAFAPVSSGPDNANAILADNSLNLSGAEQLIRMTGTGTQEAQKLAFVPAPPANVIAEGNAGIVLVDFETTDGSPVTTDTAPVTLTVTGPSGYSRVYGPVNAVAGVASFDTTLAPLVAVGSYTYTATSAGVTSATGNETVAPGAYSFGNSGQPVGTSSPSQTVTLVFNAPVTLGGEATFVSLVTQGVDGEDFKLASAQAAGACAAHASYLAGQACTVGVVFEPKYPGLRLGAVLLKDNSDVGQVVATTYISGIGLGPVLGFTSSPQISFPVNGLRSGLNSPQGVAVDGAGNLFVSDSGNNRVLELPLGATSTTVLSSNLSGPAGIAIDGAGSVFVADRLNSRVVEIPYGGGEQSILQIAVDDLPLGQPFGVAVDGLGNLYVGDQTNNRVVKVPAGCAEPSCQSAMGVRLSVPAGLAVDSAGDLYIVDQGNNRVVVIDAFSGEQTTLNTSVGGVGLLTPSGVAIDPAGNAYITDNRNRIVIVPPGADSTPTALNVNASGEPLSSPSGVAVRHDGTIDIADTGNGRIAEVQQQLALPLTFGPQALGTASAPHAVGVKNLGNASLTLSSVTAGVNTTVDAASTTCLPAGVSINGTCNIGVEFAPPFGASTTSALAGVVTLVDNAPNSPQTIDLTGRAIAGAVTIQISLAAGAAIPYGPTNLMATVVPATAGGPAPTGTIFYQVDSGAVVPAPAALTGGAVTFALPQLGAGTHTIALAYSGDANYAGDPGDVPPPARAILFTVTKAILTVTANSVTSAFGQTIPAASDTVTGFVYTDTAASAVTGTASFSTTATSTSPPGSYPLTVAQGTLAAANYSFVFVPGTITITIGAQAITFAPIPSIPYGTAPFVVSAVSSSGLPVTVAVQSGPATISGKTVTLTGAGTVILVASQTGNLDYNPATPVTQTFTVTKAVLTVTANSVTSAFGQAIPGPTDTITGFVYTDTAASAVTGTASFSTTVTSTSPPGSYPLTVAQGTLAAANYSFRFVPGTITITIGAQTIAFSPIQSIPYGTAPFAVSAAASSGLPVTVAVQSGPATISGDTVTLTGAGTVILVASQAGNVDYNPATTVTQTFVVTPATSTIALSANPATVNAPATVALTANLTSAAGGVAGNIIFLDGTTTLGQAALTNGTAGLSGVSLAAGPHTLTATYSGNANFASSASAPLHFVVGPGTISLTSINPSTVLVGALATPLTVTGTGFTATSIIDFNGVPLPTTFVSATQLQTVVAATLLATAGNETVTVTDAFLGATSGGTIFVIDPLPVVTFSGPGTSNPGEQSTLTFQLQQPYPAVLAGTMTIAFTPNAGETDDPAIQFATGGRVFNFTLAANATTTPAVMVQTGTVAGTITITLQLTASGFNVTPSNVQPIVIVVPAVAPTITSVTVTRSGTTLTVATTGFSSTREIQRATFSFVPKDGVTLDTTSLTLSADPLFQSWYSSTPSDQYGSTFTYTQTFIVSSDATSIGSVGVVLNNSIGASTEVTAQ